MAVSSASITTTTAANYIPELWITETMDAIEFAAVIQKRVNRQYEKNLKVGDYVKIQRLSNLSTQTKTSGLDAVGPPDTSQVAWEAITEGQETIQVATHQYAAFLLEDVAAVQANVDLRQKYTKKIGYALTRGREVALATLFGGLSQTVGTLAVELTSDDYLAALQYFGTAGLLEGDADPGEDFSIILSWQAYIALLKVDVFTNREYNTAGDAIQRAKVGDVYGMQTFRSNLTTSSNGGHQCVAMHRDCFALIVQKEVPVVSHYLIERFANGVAGWNLYGVAELEYPPETPGGGSATDNRGVYLATV